jgi:hypothetical protein
MEYHLRTWLLFMSSPPRLAAEFGRSPKRDTNQFDQEKKTGHPPTWCSAGSISSQNNRPRHLVFGLRCCMPSDVINGR